MLWFVVLHVPQCTHPDEARGATLEEMFWFRKMIDPDSADRLADNQCI
jgi:hypothetical protein